MPSVNDELRRALRRAYGQRVGERDQRQIQPWKLNERATFMKMLQAQGAHNLLEIGAGTGQDAEFFATQGLTVLATDLTPENVAACRQKGLEAMVMDVCDLQLKAGSYDAVFCLNTLLHLPKYEFPVALENIQRVLEPGGLFYLGLYGRPESSEQTWDEDHYEPKRLFSYFSDGDLRQALDACFEIRYFNTIALEDSGDIHFQSVIAEKPTSSP